MEKKIRAPRNRTLTIDSFETDQLLSKTLIPQDKLTVSEVKNQILFDDFFNCIEKLPDNFIDLLVVDPPYNLDKQYSSKKFSKTNSSIYEDWLESWIEKIKPCLKKNASIYICCDWLSSVSVYQIIKKHFIVRNRITWEREKGRGAQKNWKNCIEDIWFCTLAEDYYFDVDSVKLKRKVIAPYKDESGAPKDWQDTESGKFRLTHPSNIWTDLTIPFWSMPENTDHPTQKPEKLIAKLILASCPRDGMVFDPFLGSGTTAVVAKKLGRIFCGVERESEYCQMAIKRLMNADIDKTIQGYFDGFFWERNTLNLQKNSLNNENATPMPNSLFE